MTAAQTIPGDRLHPAALPDHGREALTQAIYHAALQPQAWQSVVSALGRVFMGVRFLMVGTDARHPSSVPQVHLGYSAEAASSYVGHYQHLNPWWPGWRALQPGQVAHSLSVLSEKELLRTEFYADWLRPQEDLRHGVGTVLLRDSTRAYLLAGNYRGRDAGWADKQVSLALQALGPLMRHALEVNRMLLGLRLGGLAGRAGAPGDAAVLLLAPGSRVIYMNPRAEALVRAGDLLSMGADQRLRLGCDVANDHLSAAWTEAGRHLQFRLARAGLWDEALQARLVPVSEDLRAELQLSELDGPAGPLLLLALASPPPLQDLCGTLQRSLRLTPAEAQVALALAGGQVVKEIARNRQVSVETVRNQIKSILQKTQSRRQADLVSLVAALQAPASRSATAQTSR